MIPKYQRKTIGELQHEFLERLILSQRPQIDKAISDDKINPVVMNVAQGLKRMYHMNTYAAGLYLNRSG